MSGREESLPKRQRELEISESESDNEIKRRRLVPVEKENQNPVSARPKSPRTSPPRPCMRLMEQDLKPDTPAFPSIRSRLQMLHQKSTGTEQSTPAALITTPRTPSSFVLNAHQKLQDSARPSTSQAAIIRQQRAEEMRILNTIQPVAASAWQKGWNSEPAPSKAVARRPARHTVVWPPFQHPNDPAGVDMSMSFASSDGNVSLAPMNLSQEEVAIYGEPCATSRAEAVVSSTPRGMSTSAFLDEIFKDALEAAHLEEEEEEEEEREKGESEQMEKREKEDRGTSASNGSVKKEAVAEEEEEKTEKKEEKMKDVDTNEDQEEKGGKKEEMEKEIKKEVIGQEEEENPKREMGEENEEGEGDGKMEEGEKAAEGQNKRGNPESPSDESEDELLKLPPSCILSPLSESVDRVVTPLRLAAAASVSDRLSFQLTSEGLKTPTETRPLYSIDAYRSQSRSGQKGMQSVTPWRRAPEKPRPQPLLNTKEKIKALKEDAARLQTVISQTLQALNCCVDEQHGKGSVEEAEAERLLLISSEKREALLAEIVRLEGDPEGREADAGAPPLQPCRGSINISEVHLPLKVDFVCSARNAGRPTHFFFMLFRYGPTNVMATPLATAADADGDTISFPALINLHNIRSSFEIDVEVYSMSDTPNSFCEDTQQLHRKNTRHTRHRVTPKKLLNTLKRSHQTANAAAMPSNLYASRPSKFSLVGCHKITLASLGQDKFPLDKMKLEGKIRKLLGDEFQDKVPFLSPLEGNIRLRIQSEFHSEVEHHGFLTMFKDIKGLGAWHRLFFELKEDCLYYWNHPNERDNKPEEGSIPLSDFKSQSVRPVKMDSCARPFTFELVSRTQQEEDTPSLTKRWFAADTQEERKVWMDRLNQALMDLHTWTPLAPAQDAAHNRSTQSCGSNRDSAL
ncbi:anillin isoform X2 [Clupea harengus]|uniref:Anillin isoform X2 n=1 Tax=Clupea harengus TaxID=7950 RepID=A0A6P8F9U9_CLUHA|nr:anillin isoform X2 [Clupea harengus]